VAGGRYIPATDVPLEDCLAMHDELGIARGVLVQSSSYATDNRAMLDALRRYPKRLRGVAVVSPEISADELLAMHDVGVRGLRFKQFPAEAGHRAAADLRALERLAGPMRELGWHAQLWTDPAVMLEAEPMLRGLGLPLVFDHLGQPRIEQGIQAPAFQALLGLLADGIAWIKLSAVYRFASVDPGRDNPCFPFHDALLRANPRQAVWASDWPHAQMAGQAPDAGALLDLLTAWTDDESRRRILVDNPAQLYGFEN
jgi:predicted TIM-barrel fold metal-dependent hydrolase